VFFVVKKKINHKAHPNDVQSGGGHKGLHKVTQRKNIYI
jgi:hypothetical protein